MSPRARRRIHSPRFAPIRPDMTVWRSVGRAGVYRRCRYIISAPISLGRIISANLFAAIRPNVAPMPAGESIRPNSPRCVFVGRRRSVGRSVGGGPSVGRRISSVSIHHWCPHIVGANNTGESIRPYSPRCRKIIPANPFAPMSQNHTGESIRPNSPRWWYNLFDSNAKLYVHCWRIRHPK